MAGLNISDAEFIERVTALPGVQRALDDVANELADEARDITRRDAYDEGELIQGIDVLPGDTIAERRIRMTAPGSRPAKLPVWVHQGTGVYGPRRTPIVPTKAKVLRFKPKGSDEVVYARSVKGRPATPVMRDAGVAVAARLRLRWHPSRT